MKGPMARYLRDFIAQSRLGPHTALAPTPCRHRIFRVCSVSAEQTDQERAKSGSGSLAVVREWSLGVFWVTVDWSSSAVVVSSPRIISPGPLNWANRSQLGSLQGNACNGIGAMKTPRALVAAM